MNEVFIVLRNASGGGDVVVAVFQDELRANSLADQLDNIDANASYRVGVYDVLDAPSD